ncbi:histone deacetylase family protein [Pseudohalocynthiibacter aestuariivivens]|nr:histone deacetylase family protein [Pseudohalocynthiibacter aestuariivivens]QIE46260.1 histone deacetylase family protein [Pseudohalocynthiibacter aestuariivivens]
MRAFFDHDQLLHRPLTRLAGGELRATVETPERAERLLAALRSADVDIAAPGMYPEDLLERVHSAEYLDFLRNGFEEWSKHSGNGPEMRASAHPVRAQARIPRDILGRAGYFQADASCVVTAGTWQAARASAMTALASVEHVLRSGEVAYGLCRPPGHHAARDLAGGFCYLNNSVIAAEMAVAQGLRVAILDVDVHHGNGTQALFYDRENVLTVSLHGAPEDLYPYYSGYADETGIGAGEGRNLNLPLPLMSGIDVWQAAMNSARSAIGTFKPDLMVIALGLDAFVGDPFACMALETDDFARLGEMSRYACPTVIIQEGGYPTDALGANLLRFLEGLVG